MTKSERTDRAWELDFLRGVALILMLTMHLGWDLRYEFGLNAADFLESNWYYFWIHPLNLVLFVGVAGVCCAFSRNNLKRGLFRNRLSHYLQRFACAYGIRIPLLPDRISGREGRIEE